MDIIVKMTYAMLWCGLYVLEVVSSLNSKDDAAAWGSRESWVFTYYYDRIVSYRKKFKVYIKIGKLIVPFNEKYEKYEKYENM